MKAGFEDILQSATPNVRDLARRAKTLIKSVMPKAMEVTWPRQKIISFGVGPKKMSEHFCYLSISANHVNLGFYYGAELADPANLMEGTGKLLRHIKITTPEQLKSPALRRLLVAASKHLPRLKA